jgi:hypothetical protein
LAVIWSSSADLLIVSGKSAPLAISIELDAHPLAAFTLAGGVGLDGQRHGC